MAVEVDWKAPEWPPEQSGEYSADVVIWGTLESVRDIIVKQKDVSISYKAFRIHFDHAHRVKDELDEESLGAALGPNSICDVASRFELWLQDYSSVDINDLINKQVCATTKGASLVLRAIVLHDIKAKPKGSEALDQLAARQAEYVKQFKEQEGVAENEWD